jgi:hypothetical protein
MSTFWTPLMNTVLSECIIRKTHSGPLLRAWKPAWSITSGGTWLLRVVRGSQNYNEGVLSLGAFCSPPSSFKFLAESSLLKLSDWGPALRSHSNLWQFTACPVASLQSAGKYFSPGGVSPLLVGFHLIQSGPPRVISVFINSKSTYLEP